MIHHKLLQKPFRASLSYLFGDNGLENYCNFFLVRFPIGNQHIHCFVEECGHSNFCFTIKLGREVCSDVKSKYTI